MGQVEGAAVELPKSPTLRLELAEIVVRFELATWGNGFHSIPAHHRPFLCDEQPHVDLRCQCGPFPSRLLRQNKVLFDTRWMWSLHQTLGGLLWREMSASIAAVPQRLAALATDLSSGTVYLAPSGPQPLQSAYPLQHPFEKFLFGALLARGRGVTLHACGVTIRGRGLLFVGQSGAGKSTMAQLWQRQPETTVLSDERTIVRGDSGRFRIYGTPWYGTAGLSSPAAADLSAVLLLRHGSRNRLTETQGASAVRQLLPCTYLPFWNPEGLDFSLRFLAQLSESVPCYELAFVPDDTIVEMLADLG